MKKAIALSATILTLLVATSVPAQPLWAGHGLAAGHDLDRRVERMTERLGLTREQQEQLRSIFEAQQTKRQEGIATVRAQIDAVLTDEQRVARDLKIDRRIERRVARIADRLDLTAVQEAELRTLMTENRDSTDQSGSDVRERLSAVLTEKQLTELEEMRPARGHRFRGGCMK